MSNAGQGVRIKANRLADWTAPACRIQGLELTTTPRITSSDDVTSNSRKSTVVHGERRLTCGSLWSEAAALAYIATSPHDVRPHLLLAHFAQAPGSIEAAIKYGHRYLAAWCGSVGVGRKWASALPFAAADALALMYWGRATRIGIRVAVRTRARSLNIAPRDYLLLRDMAHGVYRLRLAEAIVSFERCLSRMEILAPANPHTQSRNDGLPARSSEPLARRAA